MRLEASHVVARQDASVRVRQEPVLEGSLCSPNEVVDRAGVPELGECLAVLSKRGFGAVAESNRPFDAALRTRASDPLLDFVVSHRPGAGIVRGFAKRTVVAAVAAQIREWQEDFGRKRQAGWVHVIAQCRSRLR